MHPNFKTYLLQVTESSNCEEVEIIQSLWSGYGKIVRYKLIGSSFQTVVVKHINLEAVNQHPRGWNTSISHNRKMKSYQVETNWYKQYNHLVDDDSKTPNFIGVYNQGQQQWIVLEDLNNHFPVRKQTVNLPDIKACLGWLANFHAIFMKKEPIDLWEIGTYWHLDTRPDEFEKIQHKALKAKASKIDEKLNNAQYQTFVHGDAKLANFCFSKEQGKVAAVDFQYVGGGCGIKDVAYFLGSCLTSQELEQEAEDLLNVYFKFLQNSLNKHQPNLDFNSIETEWRALYSYACADFTRFMLGWMPTHQKINPYNLKLVEEVLKEL